MTIGRVLGPWSACVCFSVAASAQVPSGGDVQVNAYTTGRQYAFARFVAVDADGDFVAVWTSDHDGSVSGVFGQRFTAAGAALGSEFRVNTYTTGFQGEPAVAASSR